MTLRDALRVSLVVLLLAVPSGLVRAQTIDACQAAKKKCIVAKTERLVGCHARAERVGSIVDAACLSRAATGLGACWDELETRCPTIGDVTAIEAKVDAFVLDVVTRLDPVYPEPTRNRCSSRKKSCVGKAAAGLLGCHVKADTAGFVDPACLLKHGQRFDGGLRVPPAPAKGCFAKLEAKGGCLTTDDTTPLALAIDAFVADVVCALEPGEGACPTPTPTPTPTRTATPTSTRTPTPTPTDAPCVCGDGINGSCEACDPSAPPSEWSACGPDFVCTPSCTCACPSTLELSIDAADPATILDLGSGFWHRLPVISRGDVSVDLACGASSRPCGTCTVTGPIPNAPGRMQNRRCTGDTSIRCTSTIPDCNVAGGTCEFYWGGPLPIAASGVLACIVSQFDGPVSGTMNVESGEMATNVFLASRFYFGVSIDHPCPRCIGDATANDAVAGGTCDGGPRNDQTCDANGSVPGRPDYGATSLDCPPSPGGIFATLPIDISNATDPVTRTVSASSPSCSGRPGEKCLCDTCNNGTGEPCSANADCPDPPGPIGAICGGRRCLGGTNDGAACTFNSECPGSSCSRPGEPTLASYCHDDTATPGVLDCSDPDGDGEGGCTVGPVIVRCSVASGHAQRGCVADADCGGAAGSCEGVPGHCFLTGGFSGENGTNTLIADGMEDTPVRDVSHPTFGAVFCVAPTGSSNFDTVVGLPGAGRVTLKGSATARP